MKRISFVLASALLAMSLSGCASFRQQQTQGQRLTHAQVMSVHKGMTKQSVIDQLGSPVLQSIYNPNVLVYVFVMHPKRHQHIEKRLVIHFNHDRVTKISTNNF